VLSFTKVLCLPLEQPYIWVVEEAQPYSNKELIMSIDIREIDPCESCMRGKHGFDFGDQSTDAGAYLVMSAIDVSDSGLTVSDEDLQLVSNFINNIHDYRAERPAKGAVGFCGRQIGRGACNAWRLNEETSQIERRIEDEAPVHLGIDEGALTDELWREIVATYHEVVFGERPDDQILARRYFARTVIDGGGEYRLGSRISPHSKLRVRDNFVKAPDGTPTGLLISFDFQINDHTAEDENTERGQEAATIRETFRTRVDELLQARDLGQPLKT